jgi:intracellular multiplication protein IcmV
MNDIMGIRKILGVSRKTFFNPRGWLGFDLLKAHTLAIWSFATTTLRINRDNQSAEENRESFDEAMSRLEISDAELPTIANRYLLFTGIFIILAVLDAVYSGYLLFWHHSITSFMAASATVCFLLVQAFKYHFWRFQIKHRKLGCTFAEWYHGKPLTTDLPERSNNE